MEDLYKVGERVAQENAMAAGMNPAMLEQALAGGPDGLAELLAGGGNIEEYLQSYEQMLQEGIAPDLGMGPTLDQVDNEGGITTRPEPGFVVKTRDVETGNKVFINVVASPHVEAPHMKSMIELDGEEGCRVPLSVGTPVEDFDKKGEPCTTYDIVANPEVVDNCAKDSGMREQVVQLVMAALAQKYKIELDQRFKLPKIKYKGTTVQLQRIRKKKESQIQELRNAESNAPMPGESASRRAKGEGMAGSGNVGDGPPQPDFCIVYSQVGLAPPRDAFERDWGLPIEDIEEATSAPHLSGLDLPCYRVNAFNEKFRGTMKNRSQRQASEEEKANKSQAPGMAETQEFLKRRTCHVQVRLPDLDPHIASLKQFGIEVSDECMRITFPMLPKSGKVAYSNLTIWWPQHFCSSQAVADWEPKEDLLTVSLPTESEVAAEALAAFDPDLLDAVF
eukprot:TRINITY_DN5103_c2_g1_i1.p1 TRINITY_DN5103_c2_g1~~TRINITY_DN5103_c2_g1_i1.p1  ORF type:complete len:449 (+),score=104.11 TRINITY_DN5103_c2_g1_i1:80-1426(+)